MLLRLQTAFCKYGIFVDVIMQSFKGTQSDTMPSQSSSADKEERRKKE